MHTVIIGAGLSGLALARALHAAGRRFTLVDARPRLGGRILTEAYGGGDFDLGPTWFWPGQPRITALIEQLALSKFDQYTQGALIYEDENGTVAQGRGFAAMQSSWRLQGGLGALVTALAETIPRDHIHLGTQATSLQFASTDIAVGLADGQTLRADHVVLALPPRVATKIAFDPPLPPATTDTMRRIPTWMAGQAKAVALYDTPFWRDAGLSGNAISRRGPMVEIHDASPSTGGPAALFGFLGVPPQSRRDEAGLRAHLIAQLGRLFGPQAATPSKLLIKDWAFDPHTSTDDDLAPLHAHPTYRMPDEMCGLWDNRLLFAGTEVAPEFGGYLEGALEAAENTFAELAGTP